MKLLTSKYVAIIAQYPMKQVGDLLKTWDLYKVFGAAFSEQQIDGELLQECETGDFTEDDFPEATQQDWTQFW